MQIKAKFNHRIFGTIIYWLCFLVLFIVFLGIFFPDGNRTSSNRNQLFIFGDRSSNNVFVVDKKHRIVLQEQIGIRDSITAKRRKDKIYVLSKHRGLSTYDLNSQSREDFKLGIHHDFSFKNDSQVYAFQDSVRKIKNKSRSFNIIDTDIILYDFSKRSFVKRKSLYKLLKNNIASELLSNAYRDYINKDRYLVGDGSGDIFHANSIEVIDKTLNNIFDINDLLISVRAQNKVFIVNEKLNLVKWECCGKELSGQHSATLTSDSKIAIFDNGLKKTYSRAILVDPETKQIIWEFSPKTNPEVLEIIKSYKLPKQKEFYTYGGGGIVELKNGNFLITVDELAMAFEVTRKNKIVWVFNKYELETKLTSPREHIFKIYPFDY